MDIVEDCERTLALWDLRTDATDVSAAMERMLREAYPVLAGDEALAADGFQPRVFSAIALTAFRYVLEGEGHTMEGVRDGMREYLSVSGKMFSAFE